MSEILTVEKFKECIEDLAFDRWGDSELFAHDAALRLALETATRRCERALCPGAAAMAASGGAEIDKLRGKLTAAERERDDFVEKLKAAHKREDGYRIERDEARVETKRLMSLTQNWYEGRARIGAHMTFVDQRFYDSVRLQRTGWPGDDANGDGGPPEE